MKVLLVQHQTHARRLFKHLLTSQDCIVTDVDSLEGAVAESRRGQFDLIFIDEPLPNTKPQEAIRRLRSIDATAYGLIVVLVERSQERNLPAIIGAGADEYLVLPSPLEEVQLRLSVILGWARRIGTGQATESGGKAEADRFFEGLPDAAVMLDRVGTVVAANKRLATLTGYTVPQLVGQPAEFIGLPMAEEMPELLEESASSRDRLENITLVRRDMKPVPAVIRYAWLDPEVRSIVVGVARETGETGLIAEATNQEPDARVAGIAYFEFDRSGTVTAASRDLADLLGTPRTRLLGMSVRDLIHRADLAEIPALMKPRQHDGDSTPATARLRLRTTDGEWRDLEMAGAPLGQKENDRYRLQVRDQTDTEDRTHAAGIDSLTGLPDRDGFLTHVNDAFEADSGSIVAILFINVDRFKGINEKHGYVIGDRFVVEFVNRLKSILTFTDVLGRVGGDEFAILAGAVGSHADALDLATRLVENLSNRPINAGGIEELLTASIGIALAEPTATTPAELLRQADGATVQAKENGRGKVQIYESRLEKIKSDSLHMEQDLLQALQRDELVVHYQPEVDLNTGAIVGVEALVRWNHPTQGLIEPGQFIPTAEDAGLIDPIGLWVVENAAERVSGWISRFGLQDFNLSVNYSAYQLAGENLVMEISGALRRSGLPPSVLRIELTESVMIADDAETLRKLDQIRKFGIHLAIDDFGTGHASLSYLRSLPVTHLKVDRSFVSGASALSGKLSLTRSIATLADDSGLSVVVEGIETAAQLRRVQEIGCDRGQGYYFSRPVGVETMEFLLMAGPYPFASMVRVKGSDQPAPSNTSSS